MRFNRSITVVTLAVLLSATTIFAEKRPDDPNTVLAYQLDNGGWPKNYDRREKLTTTKLATITKNKDQIKNATIDNGATHRDIRILAAAHAKTGKDKFATAALNGINYLLSAQYSNGGWPQFYPQTKGYHGHITFNDGAMIGVMSLFQDIVKSKDHFSFVPETIRQQCVEANRRGLECILRCQIRVDGKMTVWCAQHDQESLAPRKARSYELASLSGSESVGIVRYLMSIENPSPRVVNAIKSAVTWFKQSQINGQRLEKFTREDGKTDRRLVPNPDATPLWARFYDIKTNRPIYCSRDGIPRATLAEISHERRNGYS
ncbi:MAG: pectate lyase, partial [Planctomycetota bacterium]